MGKLKWVTIPLALIMLASAASATTIQYQLSSLGGNSYRYDWNVINNPLSVDIEDFIVFFSDVLVPEGTNLALIPSAPVNWWEAVVQPSGGPTNLAGYYEAWTSPGFGIAQGKSLNGFAAKFDWNGTTAKPGSQYFEVYDSQFNVIDSGYTVPMGGGQIPEWGSMALCITGLGPILMLRRRKR